MNLLKSPDKTAKDLKLMQMQLFVYPSAGHMMWVCRDTPHGEVTRWLYREGSFLFSFINSDRADRGRVEFSNALMFRGLPWRRLLIRRCEGSN